jgi:hypothetical protein
MRFNTLEKIVNIIMALKEAIHFNFIINNEERAFRNILLEKKNVKNEYLKKSVLLVPLINDLGTMKVILKIADYIGNKESLETKYFFIHTAIDKKYKNNISGFINRLSTWSYISMYKIRKIYAIDSKDIIISNHIRIKRNTYNRIKRFHSKSDVLLEKYREIEIGELLYDTYLRFRAKPTVDIYDDDLYEIYNYMLQLTDQWDDFYEKNKISKLLLPYMSYHSWGIPGKSALKHNVDVVTFGSHFYIFQNAKIKYPYHTKDFTLYPSIYESIANKEACIQAAKQNIEARLSGKIDKGVYYMKNTAFEAESVSAVQFPEKSNWAVIFLHCFFDSPHGYGNGLFPDFYEWLTFLLDQASLNPSVTYYFKGHPNALPENISIVNAFIEKYAKFENIIFLSAKISNSIIIKSNPQLIVTYYGTVAHEFAYCGIPAVTCGDNPHSEYDFVYHAKSIDELSWFIKNVGNFGLPAKYRKENILEFFYMHYMYYSKKYDQINFDLGKNMETGVINLPLYENFDNMVFKEV